MKIKRYKGASLEKIRDVILKELGENAVIVNIQKTAGDGLLSLGRKTAYEVIAALEEPVNADGVPLDSHGAKNLEVLLDDQKEQYKNLRKSIKLIDEKLVEVDGRLGDIATKAPVQASCPDELRNVHDEWRPLLAETVRKIAKSAAPTPEDWHEALASIVPTAGGILFRKATASVPDVYVFVGSTGVGKTTTLAKLAAKCVLADKLSVGIITLDTFRVAAVDQLREYASLLGAEMAVAFSAGELKAQLTRFSGKDVVFIDTPGRGQFDEVGIKSISDCLAGAPGLCSVLVVPANIRQEEARIVCQSYASLKPSAIVISKADEAVRCDGLTRLFDMARLPVVYIADGQRVPEDIHMASPGVVASLVMPVVTTKENVKIGGSADDRKGGSSGVAAARPN